MGSKQAQQDSPPVLPQAATTMTAAHALPAALASRHPADYAPCDFVLLMHLCMELQCLCRQTAHQAMTPGQR